MKPPIIEGQLSMVTSDDEEVTFDVQGTPRPQGSKKLGDHGQMIESSPHVAAWRERVHAMAVYAMIGRDVWTGPVEARVVFSFARPMSHFKGREGARIIRPGAPVYHVARPDLDKLLRAVFDAITGVVWRDDSQAAVVAAHKIYAPGIAQGCRVVVRRLAP